MTGAFALYLLVAAQAIPTAQARDAADVWSLNAETDEFTSDLQKVDAFIHAMPKHRHDDGMPTLLSVKCTHSADDLVLDTIVIEAILFDHIEKARENPLNGHVRWKVGEQPDQRDRWSPSDALISIFAKKTLRREPGRYGLISDILTAPTSAHLLLEVDIDGDDPYLYRFRLRQAKKSIEAVLTACGHPSTKPARIAQLGTWTVAHFGLVITTTLYEEGGLPLMRQEFEDGSSVEAHLSRRVGEYYLPSGEWFVVTDNGNLDLHDADGLIWSAKPAN